MNPLSQPAPRTSTFQSWQLVLITVTLLAAAITSGLYIATVQAGSNDGAITGLTLTSDAPGTLTVSWEAASPTPTDYRVDWAKSTEDYKSWKVDEGHVYPAGTATAATITDLDHDTEYKVRMRARYYRGEHVDSPWSGTWAEASLQVAGNPEPTPTPEPSPEPTPEPGAIVVLTATDDEAGQLVLTWGPPAAPHAEPTDYHVNWAKGTEDYPADTATAGNAHPTTITHTLAGLDYDTEYKVRVRARYTDGENADSPWNGPWTETTAQVKLPLPAAPSIVGTAVTSDGQVLLSWLNLSDDSITSHQVLRGPDADSLAVIEDDTGSNATSYTDTEAPAGQTHTYAVKARNASGLSPLSDTVAATVPAVEVEKPLVTARHEASKRTLVSNLGQTAAPTGGVIGTFFGNRYDHAMPFTTGSNPLGYHVTSVQLALGVAAGSGTATPQVSIRGDNGGIPGETALYTLTTSSAITNSGYQLFSFTTANETTLQPNTTYWLYIATAGTNAMSIENTASEDEDAESEANWQIGNTRYFRVDGGTWAGFQANTIRMEISGHAAPEFLVSNLDARRDELSLSHQTPSLTARIAQSFSAANNADGATVEFDFHGITVFIGLPDEAVIQIPGNELLITLNSDQSGQPGGLVYTLNPPQTIATSEIGRRFTFTAPAGSTLSSGVTYWLKIETEFDSTYFDRNYALMHLTPDDSEVQGPATENRWSIGDSSLQSGQVLSWNTNHRSIKMTVLGAQLLGPLVSNLGQLDGDLAVIATEIQAAQAFVAGPGPAGFRYRLQGIRVAARSHVLGNDVFVPEVRVSLHRDVNGRPPGSRLLTLTVPDDFASTSEFAEYTLEAPPGTVIPGGSKYWVVFKTLSETLLLRTTSSPDEDQVPPPVDGWLIDNERYITDSYNVWQRVPQFIEMAVLGLPEWASDEPDGEDFPGATDNGQETPGVVIPGTVSTGHLTPGLDRNHGLTGDY